MSEYPSEFESDALLSDGRGIHLRPIRQEDADRERRFFERVGPESAYFRFFSPKPALSSGELRHFTTVDYEDRMAFVAIHGDDMVAVGRFDVLSDDSDSDHKVAEIALLVEDDFQNCGLGSRLLDQLTVYARLKGVTGFVAFVLAENGAMLRLLSDTGYKLIRHFDEAAYRIEFSIE